MKKTLYFFAAMTLVASSAMASKARLSALGNSQVAVDSDIQGIFQNPAYMHYVGDFATFEMGEKAGTAAEAVDNEPNPEGGFISTMGDAKFGVYLGKQSTDTNSFRKGLNTVLGAERFLQQENPFEVFYGAKAGDLNWGASFTYSNSDLKTTEQKQNAMGLRMGVRTDDWAAFANVGLGSSAKNAAVGEVKGTSGIQLGGHYMMDNMRVYGIYQGSGAKFTTAAGTTGMDATVATTSIGFTNAWKNEGNLAFYGVSYEMYNKEDKTSKNEEARTSLPVTIGAEVAATSWMKLRGSVAQNVLLGSKKLTAAGVAGKIDTATHDTVTAAGAGFNWGHNNLDVVMTMGTSAEVDSTNFGTNASYTYMF
ncbi:MAG: hypothetical protein RJB66_2468 [Pseudomonadota bacterium]|jgi:hypothetical protein